MLRGTIRDHVTQQRRPFVRFFACEQDLSHEPPDAPLPDAVATGPSRFSSSGPWPAGSDAGGSTAPPAQNPAAGKGDKTQTERGGWDKGTPPARGTGGGALALALSRPPGWG